MIKIGRDVWNPMNQKMRVLDIRDGVATCKTAGPYGATRHYPVSALRPCVVEVIGEDGTPGWKEVGP